MFRGGTRRKLPNKTTSETRRQWNSNFQPQTVWTQWWKNKWY